MNVQCDVDYSNLLDTHLYPRIDTLDIQVNQRAALPFASAARKSTGTRFVKNGLLGSIKVNDCQILEPTYLVLPCNLISWLCLGELDEKHGELQQADGNSSNGCAAESAYHRSAFYGTSPVYTCMHPS